MAATSPHIGSSSPVPCPQLSTDGCPVCEDGGCGRTRAAPSRWRTDRRPEATSCWFSEPARKRCVYDERTHRAHCLDARATRVWELCNGARTESEIAAVYGEGEAGRAVVSWTLGELEKSALLEGSADVARAALNRRVLMKTVGLAAIPVIMAITAPRARAAVSTCSSAGQECATKPCCAGLTCQTSTMHLSVAGAPMFPTLLRDTFRAAPVEAMAVSPALLASAEVSGIEALVRRRLDDAPSNVERFQALEQLGGSAGCPPFSPPSPPTRSRPSPSRAGHWRDSTAAPGCGRSATWTSWFVPRTWITPAGCSPRSRVAPRWTSRRILSRYLPDRSAEQLVSSSRPVEVPGGTIRMLAPADHLRLVCLHQLHHGSWRPLWLCDVAVLVEALPPGFTWDDCLRGSRHLGEGVLALVELARRWLGARPSVEPPPSEAPEWFERAILRAWKRGYRPSPERLQGLSLARLPGALRARWPDPLSSTLHLDAPFHGLPRLPIQVAELVRRGSRHAFRRWRARATEIEKRGRP